jgi:hypothetical protein
LTGVGDLRVWNVRSPDICTDQVGRDSLGMGGAVESVYMSVSVVAAFDRAAPDEAIAPVAGSEIVKGAGHGIDKAVSRKRGSEKDRILSIHGRVLRRANLARNRQSLSEDASRIPHRGKVSV